MANTVHLIASGDWVGTLSSELRVGMRLVWNYGSEYDVIAVRDASPKFIEITERRLETGVDYIRRLKKDRLVVAFWPKGRS